MCMTCDPSLTVKSALSYSYDSLQRAANMSKHKSTQLPKFFDDKTVVFESVVNLRSCYVVTQDKDSSTHEIWDVRNANVEPKFHSSVQNSEAVDALDKLHRAEIAAQAS